MLESVLHFDKIITQSIYTESIEKQHLSLDVLRTDLIHEVISGNKWFKLSKYLVDAEQKGFHKIGTFGGAYSNHLAATAFAAKQAGFESIGIVRGERPAKLSHTLEAAAANGMELNFVSRSEYRQRSQTQQTSGGVYWIAEGGCGILGAEGAADILSFIKNPDQYNYLIAAVGTGTMLAGIINTAGSHQSIVGISAMKGNTDLKNRIEDLLPSEKKSQYLCLFHDYHFGGYAKHPQKLIDFMNRIYYEHNLPTDIVYTSKAMYATFDLIEKNYFIPGSKILLVHSGGLQGNFSLDPQTLRF